MKKFILLTILFATSVQATVIDDAKDIMQALSGKTLSNAQMLSIASRYADANGYKNPWDAIANPTEFAAWPTNLELATYFVTRVRNQIRADIGRAAGTVYDDANTAARDAAVIAAQDEL